MSKELALPSLEIRRLAVAQALRAVAREPRLAAATPVALAAATPVAGPLETRLDALAGQIGEVLKRLDSVETSLLESVWERTPAATPRPPSGAPLVPANLPPASADGDVPDDEVERVSVPAVPLDGIRMSSGAAKALFG